MVAAFSDDRGTTLTVDRSAGTGDENRKTERRELFGAKKENEAQRREEAKPNYKEISYVQQHTAWIVSKGSLRRGKEWSAAACVWSSADDDKGRLFLGLRRNNGNEATANPNIKQNERSRSTRSRARPAKEPKIWSKRKQRKLNVSRPLPAVAATAMNMMTRGKSRELGNWVSRYLDVNNDNASRLLVLDGYDDDGHGAALSVSGSWRRPSIGNPMFRDPVNIVDDSFSGHGRKVSNGKKLDGLGSVHFNCNQYWWNLYYLNLLFTYILLGAPPFFLWITDILLI